MMQSDYEYASAALARAQRAESAAWEAYRGTDPGWGRIAALDYWWNRHRERRTAFEGMTRVITVGGMSTVGGQRFGRGI
jgi:hypothetical protein